jgi:hypothetical protein
MPNSVVVLRFMAPLFLWAIAVVAVFGVSFTELANLQGPLSSLNAAAHVNYRVSRVRLMGEGRRRQQQQGRVDDAAHSHSPSCLACPAPAALLLPCAPPPKQRSASQHAACVAGPYPPPGNFLAYSELAADNTKYRTNLLNELHALSLEVCGAC